MCYLSFEISHTKISWILRMLRAKTQTKVHDFVCTLKKNRHSWRTQYYACIDRLNLMSDHSTADNGVRTGFNRLLMALCTPRLSIFSQVQKYILSFCLVFRPIAFLTSNRFQCVISQMKENTL